MMKKDFPPRWLESILRRVCDPKRLEGILGDLEEIYEQKQIEKGSFRAKVNYLINAFGFLRPFAWKKKSAKNNRVMFMFKNHLKLAVRNFLGHKISSTINVLGFTIGMVSCLLIGLYLLDEYQVDQFHEKGDRIYRMAMDVHQRNGELMQTAFSPAPWAPAMKEDFPEVEAYTRLMRYRLEIPILVEGTTKSFYERNFIWADSSIFSIFSFPLMEGDPKTALAAPNSVVLSESTAKKYFGTADPIGKTISYEGTRNLTVTGVMQDLPRNSHIQADFFASFSTLKQFWTIIEDWEILYYYSYFLLDENGNIEELSKKMPDFISRHMIAEVNNFFKPQFQALNDIYLSEDRENELEAGGSRRRLFLFIGIAVLILLIACVNYINMTTANGIKRVKEVSIRKVLGSGKKNLVFQFLGESLFQIVLSVGLTILVSLLLLPLLNELSGKNISLIGNQNFSYFLFFIIGLGILIGIIAGLYPALFMAGMQPTQIINKNKNTRTSKFPLRKVLVVFQFAVCSALIAGALLMSAQFKFITQKDTGFNRDQVALFKLNGGSIFSLENMELLKAQMEAEAEVKLATLSSHSPIGDQPYYGRYQFEGIPNVTEALSMGRLHIDADFISTFDIDMVAGRAFDKAMTTDTSAFVINETAVRRLGLSTPKEAIGKLISYSTQGENGNYIRRGPIIGVTEDFHFRSLHFQIEPMVMDIQPARFHFLSVKGNGPGLIQNLPRMQEKWNAILPDAPFDMKLMDDLFYQQYDKERRARSLFGMFTIIGLLIACLGLFGLSIFITAQRTKEVGIRKVLGASVSQVILLLSRDMLLLIGFSLLIGLPLAAYLGEKWLTQFTYRIPLNIGLFIWAAFLAIGIAIFTVSVNAIKAALANPVNAIRDQ